MALNTKGFCISHKNVSEGSRFWQRERVGNRTVPDLWKDLEKWRNFSLAGMDACRQRARDWSDRIAGHMNRSWCASPQGTAWGQNTEKRLIKGRIKGIYYHPYVFAVGAGLQMEDTVQKWGSWIRRESTLKPSMGGPGHGHECNTAGHWAWGACILGRLTGIELGT